MPKPVVLDLELDDGPGAVEVHVDQSAHSDAFLLDLCADERPERHAPLAVEADVVEQHERRTDGDDVVGRLRRGEGQEPRRLVTALHDESEHASTDRVEEEVDGPAEQDAVQTDGSADQAGRGEGPHGDILPIPRDAGQTRPISRPRSPRRR